MLQRNDMPLHKVGLAGPRWRIIMPFRSSIVRFAAALLALSSAALVVPAHAQEAIQLEIIGAVRMATPQEVQRMNADIVRAQPEPSVQPASLPRQHASVAE